MFKINRKTDYAARACVALAKRPPGARLATRAIQVEMDIPAPLLRRVVAELAGAGIVHTMAGPKGGVALARPPGEITLKDIFLAMEGALCLSDCLTDPQGCPLGETCPVRERWGSLQAVILKELGRTSLRQLAGEAQGAAAATPQPVNITLSRQPVATDG